MKIVLTEWCKNWRGQEPQKLKANLLDLDVQNLLMFLVVSVGNGNFDEACIETDNDETLQWIRALLTGTGGAVRVTKSSDATQCRLYRSGYEVYRQGNNSFFFVNSNARPDLFANVDLGNYESEFIQDEIVTEQTQFVKILLRLSCLFRGKFRN
jgi:hypothetical protein